MAVSQIKKADAFYALIMLGIGIFAFVYAARYDTVSAQYITSSALFPRIISVGLILSALAVFVSALRGKKKESDADVQVDFVSLCVSLSAFAAYYLLLRPLGFLIDSALLVFFCMYRLGCRKWVVMAVYSVMLPAVVFGIFYYVFYVGLPLGVLSDILPKY